MNVQVELKKPIPQGYVLRSITPSFYNYVGVGKTPTLAKASLTRYLPGGVDYEFEIVGF